MSSLQQQYAQLGLGQAQAPRLPKQSERSNNWRNFSEGAVPPSRTARMSSPPTIQTYGQESNDMQMYHMQQTQMALQLEALKLQNLEMQERLMAAMNNPFDIQQQQQQARSRSRPTSLISEPGFNYAAQKQAIAQEEESRQQRRGALVNLQRASQNRQSDSFSEGIPSPVQSTFGVASNRLSFTGGDGLAERAIARKAAQQQAAEDSFKRGHMRGSSSLSSSGSPLLSETHKQVTSPSGPTLVLSQPGDEFPSPSLGKGAAFRGPPKRLSVSTSRPVDSDSTSSSPRTPDSERSEVQSFESVTSFASSDSASFQHEKEKPRVSLGLGRLNPSATTFNPTTLAPAFKPTRNFSAPSALMSGGVVRSRPFRQPRGPAPDEELATKNFSSRVRARSIAVLRSGRNSPAPPSPTGASPPLSLVGTV